MNNFKVSSVHVAEFMRSMQSRACFDDNSQAECEGERVVFEKRLLKPPYRFPFDVFHREEQCPVLFPNVED
ncbi:MAG: hypothetical protein KBF88_04300 [Polyangiaceae bacterium]|nr:hypothetical protein [Polyangiaceae bacterium]